MNTARLLQKITSWPCVAALCLLILVGTLCVKLWPRTVPFDQCSELYQRYADQPGIDASFVKDFRINDTVAVDATLLCATDAAGWETLRRDFAVPDPPPQVQQYIDEGEDLIASRRIAPSSYSKRPSPDTTAIEVLAYSHHSHTLTVFHAKDLNELHAIYHHNYNESINAK